MSVELIMLGVRFVLGFVFLAAAVPKLRDRADFEHTVASYELLPPRLVPVVARGLPPLELALALALLLGIGVHVAGGLTALLLLAFAAAVAVNLARGRSIDCGCFSSSAPRTISWPLVATDAVLAAGAVALATQAPATWTLVGAGTAAAPADDHDAAAMLLAAASIVLLHRLVGEYLRLRRLLRFRPASTTAA